MPPAHPANLPSPEQRVGALPPLERFEEIWRRGEEPRIEDFLPPAIAGSDGQRRELLEELIKIDLECRWRRFAQRNRPERRLEDYAQLHPELGKPPSFPVDLIAEEYRVRQRWGDRPDQQDYAARFPAQGAPLSERLRQVDSDLAAECSLAQKGLPQTSAKELLLGARPAATAVPLSLRSLVESCRRSNLLSPAQLSELGGAGLSGFSESRSLAQELLRRGWLTPYQVNRLLQGRAEDLRIGQYLVLLRLGEGGAGQVFKARHLKMDRTVALKVIRKELLKDAEVVGRFYREMRVVGKLSHPHVVHAFDAGPIGPVHVLVMEFVDGTDLNEVVKKSGPLPAAEACEYIRQAALGLQHAHERRLVHRDIKPANLLLTRPPGGFGTVKIADLGLARLRKSAAESSYSSVLTPQSSVLMGTPDYLAPEQAMNFHAADIRADIYSLGCTLYFLLTGQPPFPGGNVTEKLVRHQQSDLPDLGRFRSDVPPRVKALLYEMLAKQPENRCQTPAEVAEVLTVAKGGSVGRTPPSRRRWLKAVAAGGVLALCGLAGGGLWWQAGRSPSTSVSSGVPSPAGSESWPLDQLAPQTIDGGTMLVNSGTTPLQAIPWHVKGAVCGVAIRQDGALIAAATVEGPIHLWDVSTRKTRSLPGHAGGTYWVTFAPDGRTLASGGMKDKVVKLWDANAGTGPIDLAGHGGTVTAGAFSPRGLLATVDLDGNLKYWDPAASKESIAVENHIAGWVNALAFDRDGRTLAAGMYTRSPEGPDVLLWDTAGRRSRVAVESRGNARFIALAPDGQTLAVARNTSTEVELYDLATGKRQGPSLRAHTKDKKLRTVAFSPDGSRLASTGQEVKDGKAAFGGEVILWDAISRAKRRQWTLPAPNPQCGAIFTPDGRHLLTGSGDHVYILRLEPATQP